MRSKPKYKHGFFQFPLYISVEKRGVAGLHWAISINVTTYHSWEFFLDGLAYMARSSAENRVTWHGYHACPSTYREWHVWGKIPWQQFKNMKWWFTPLLVIRRHQ